MNSRFKFPRRVRIHGGECGAVARALHHEAQEDALMSYERASLVPSRFGESPRIDFIERKQMSTKTTLKRIALVAVSALGFGVLTSVAPASASSPAAAITVNSITVGTPAAARIGTSGNIPVTFGWAQYSPSTINPANDTFTVGIRVTSAPATSLAYNASSTEVVAGGFLTVDAVTQDADKSGIAAGAAGSYDIGTGKHGASTSTVVTVRSGATNATVSASVNFKFKPDAAGTYNFLIWAGGSTWSATYVQSTATVTTVGTPTQITLTKYGVAPAADLTIGSLIIASFKDANGNATRIATGESFAVTVSGTPTVAVKNPAGATLTSLSTSDEGAVAGTYPFYVMSANAAQDSGTELVTVAGSGGIIPATTSTNTTVSVVKTGTTADVLTINLDDATGYKLNGTAPDNDYFVGGGSSHVFKATKTAVSSETASTSYALTVIEGGRTYGAVATFAATKGSTTFTVTGSVSSTNTTITVRPYLVTTDAMESVLTRQLAAADAIAIEGQSTVLSATGGTNKFTAKVTDQYGNGVQYQAVTVSVAGRNTVASTSIGVTDANGLISYSLTDKGTTGTKDTVTFGASGATTTSSAAATINYGTVTVSKVTVSGGSKAETVAGSTLTAIDASDNGPDASAKPIKAVVTDANGNLLAGVPVTFTVDAGAIKKTAGVDFSTVYTDANGAATTQVLGWKAGKQTITATAGGVSSTDYFTWAATDATSARVLSGTVTGNILSYKVVDRFGNPVTGVKITLSRTGSGLFGNGASTQEITTDKTGSADASFTGDATVVAELATTTQGYEKAGEIAATAVTAAVAGTTKGTGDTLAPAGVGKVELKVALGVDASTVAANAAADAAAEAIDAANAATDAANLAAEAADAATVAAEEARDAADAATAAVEELATQVATLMAALKAQITTLANTVAKIAKKVRA